MKAVPHGPEQTNRSIVEAGRQVACIPIDRDRGRSSRERHAGFYRVAGDHDPPGQARRECSTVSRQGERVHPLAEMVAPHRTASSWKHQYPACPICECDRRSASRSHWTGRMENAAKIGPLNGLSKHLVRVLPYAHFLGILMREHGCWHASP